MREGNAKQVKKTPSTCGIFKIKVNSIEVQVVYTMNVSPVK